MFFKTDWFNVAAPFPEPVLLFFAESDNHVTHFQERSEALKDHNISMQYCPYIHVVLVRLNLASSNIQTHLLLMVELSMMFQDF
jgi:hypothetical protein